MKRRNLFGAMLGAFGLAVLPKRELTAMEKRLANRERLLAKMRSLYGGEEHVWNPNTNPRDVLYLGNGGDCMGNNIDEEGKVYTGTITVDVDDVHGCGCDQIQIAYTFQDGVLVAVNYGGTKK